MNQIKQMREDLLGLGLSKGTIRVYCATCSQFMQHQKGTPDHHDALRFLGEMRETSKENTCRVAYYALRALFKSMSLAFDVPPPKTNPQVDRPCLTKQQIQALIAWAKAKGTVTEKAYLALSTLYGLRRSELVNISLGDVDEGTIMIWTKKGGQPRKHLIPDPIVPIIYAAYEEWGNLSETAASILFKAILIQSGLGFHKNYGWHSIRRSLRTELLRNKVDTLIAHQFMRWSLGRSPLAIDVVYTQLADIEIDEMVFENHPFLCFWSEKLLVSK